MSEKPRARILCVDDEPAVLDGLGLNLGRRYAMSSAPSGADALALIEREGAPDVIVSDMRMPGMDGATFLARVRQLYPDTVRILLTGQADTASAIKAVNEGQVFRFLTKPCAPADMLAAIAAAVEQRRLIVAERVLLEQTLHGSIKALTDVLALTHPAAFGRATRVKQSVTDILTATGATERWQVEVAAMLSQLGFASLPPEVSEKVYFGHRLTPQEEALVAKVPQVTGQLIGNIPRLELVRAMLAGVIKAVARDPAISAADHELVARGTSMLRLAIDFDLLEGQGATPAVAFATLRGRKGTYDEAQLEAFAAVRGESAPREEVREVNITGLIAGMVLARDVMTTGGALLVARGYQLTESLLDRLRHFRPGSVGEPILVIVRLAPAPAAATARAR
ncbi:MAG TPA: response regulator [Kofleriaceae bacterium]|nr:response regulator [Kofleriaceae bacterium]